MQQILGNISGLDLKEPDGTKYDTYCFKDVNGDLMDSWTQIVKNGDVLTLPVAQEKSGYKFVGWETNGNVIGGASASITVNNVIGTDFTVTPKFQKVGYVFFLDKNGAVCYTAEGNPGDPVGEDHFSSAEMAASATLKPSESIEGWKNGEEDASG